MDKFRHRYVKNLLDEARKLIHRVQEGIYAEYGWATTSLTEEQLSERKVNFGLHILPQDEPHSKSVDASKGIAWMYEDSFQHFVKKLLNALITNDHFFVILGERCDWLRDFEQFDATLSLLINSKNLILTTFYQIFCPNQFKLRNNDRWA